MPEAIDVELTNITKKFGDLVAVKDISFQVPRGFLFLHPWAKWMRQNYYSESDRRF